MLDFLLFHLKPMVYLYHDSEKCKKTSHATTKAKKHLGCKKGKDNQKHQLSDYIAT